jgi:hypothetical protein
MPVSISGTDGITSPTITTTGVIVSGTTVADATAVIRPLVSATSVASTSGTSIDFTSIPSWVKRITVMFSAVSTNGSSIVQIQIGTSGGIEATGYSGASSNLSSGVTSASYTAGFAIRAMDAAAYSTSGAIQLTNISSNTWVAFGVVGNPTSVALTGTTGSTKSLSGTLDRIRITTVNGTDTFDAGTVNILYE